MKDAGLRLDPRGLGDPDRLALIGVSGGRDSMALLTALAALGRKLIVCHFDHAWRAESAAEGALVLAQGTRLGLEVACERAPAGLPKTEAAARRARLEFFARIAERIGCDQVFLAHHADDQVETVLWNFLRGSGTAGLAGMRPDSVQQIGGQTLRILRPLLGTWRIEIDDYVAKHGVRYSDDASNAGAEFTRNRIRNLLLPEIERVLKREVREAIWRAAEIAASEEAWMSEAVPEWASDPELSVGELRQLPLALQRRTIRAWLKANRVANVDFNDVENVRSMLDYEHIAKINLTAGYLARRRAGRLFLEASPQG